MKKAVKIPLIVLGSIIGLLLVVLLLASPIAKSYIEKHDSELIGRGQGRHLLNYEPLCRHAFFGHDVDNVNT